MADKAAQADADKEIGSNKDKAAAPCRQAVIITPNLCGDISAFEKIEDTPPHALFKANGNEEVVKQKGTVVMLLFNEHSKKMEERLLEGVYYTPNASLNIIALDYLQN
ncbi:hypothetical protein P43SY_008419 [Pythium insidiosum]|uniref:Uncharacterized protein n=1 Tax=Pythium insidiosum TaxID=114742 RepID=A0AAD5LXB6_PYTIN|nr:hypothetical protein P43SY_008419 [Pythium insidiosum]